MTCHGRTTAHSPIRAASGTRAVNARPEPSAVHGGMVRVPSALAHGRLHPLAVAEAQTDEELYAFQTDASNLIFGFSIQGHEATVLSIFHERNVGAVPPGRWCQSMKHLQPLRSIRPSARKNSTPFVVFSRRKWSSWKALFKASPRTRRAHRNARNGNRLRHEVSRSPFGVVS
jgi:hypothetical protein